jgi:catechol 2,3-dioxygenase-like lactoylglutathione lyase family enzyme
MIDINGMAHVILTVSQFDKAKEFYKGLLPEFGMKQVFDGDEFCYHVGARTAIGIQRCDPAYEGEKFVQMRVGLHHICLRARSREDVDKAGAKAAELGATIVRGPMDGDWAPGYYYVLFEDPDGIRFEVNFVPGQGVLKEGEALNPSGTYQ